MEGPPHAALLFVVLLRNGHCCDDSDLLNINASATARPARTAVRVAAVGRCAEDGYGRLVEVARRLGGGCPAKMGLPPSGKTVPKSETVCAAEVGGRR